jgi:TonB family protein
MNLVDRRLKNSVALGLIMTTCFLSLQPANGQDKCASVNSPAAGKPTLQAQPLNAYCDKVKELLRSNWTDDQSFAKASYVRLKVDAGGKIFNVARSAFKSPSAEAEECAKRRLSDIDRFEPPPGGTPLTMEIRFCNDPAKMTITAIPDFDWTDYMLRLQAKIKHAWTPLRIRQSNRAVVSFKVRRDGNASDISLHRSSGAAIVDEIALETISKTAPFAPLPDGAPDFVEIQFTFDYNVFSLGPEAAP